MTLPVTAFVAAICALLLLFTAIDTVRHRIRAKAAFGYGDEDAKLIKRQPQPRQSRRACANCHPTARLPRNEPRRQPYGTDGHRRRLPFSSA